MRTVGRFTLLAVFLVVSTLGAGSAAAAKGKLVMISSDPFTNSQAQHKTEVESDNASYGQTIVSAYQTGRYGDSDAGSSDIGWATSTNGGSSWTYGFMPGISTVTDPSDPYQRVTDPAVAYDVKHNVWMVISLPCSPTSCGSETYLIPIVSLSSDAMTWSNPVLIAPNNGDFMDKPWIACDDWTSSPYYGNCYAEWIDVDQGEVLYMSVSSNGGTTWSTPVTSPGGAYGNGGQPVVQANGNVVIPFLGYGIETVNSSNGGKTWSSPIAVASANEETMPGGIRDPGPLPSARVDGAGNVYVAWADCSFRPECESNDIVYSTSADGAHWSAVSRIPIEPLKNKRDFFMPGINIDPTTSGSTAHIGVSYYYANEYSCSSTTCRYYGAFISSTNGGTSWNRPETLSKEMQVSWLPESDLGPMLCDYTAVSFANHEAFTTLPIASAPSGGQFQQAVYANAKGLDVVRDPVQLRSIGERQISRHPRLPRPVSLIDQP